MTPRRSPVLYVAVALAIFLPGCFENFSLFGPERTEWAFTSTGLAKLANDGLTGAGVKVAIVDTGIDMTHPALKDVAIAGWVDLVNGRSAPYDDNGHGSHVSSILAASGPFTGGAPGVSLFIYKAISGDQKGSDANVGQAIRDATSRGADIICLSLGGGRFPILGSSTSNAAASAVNAGVFVVAAAGNEGASTSDVATPADESGVIAVGAVNEKKQLAGFTNKGASGDPTLVGITPRKAPHQKPEIVAPGVAITGAWTGGEYRIADGTSQAAPFACAGLALLLEKNPGLKRVNAQTVTRVKQALMETAEKIPGQSTPHDARAGYGFLRADKLVARLAP